MKELLLKYKNDFLMSVKEFKNKKTRIKQIPNLLTFSRLLAPFFIIPLMAFNHLYIALIFTILFSITDLIDGRIARKYNCKSEFGRELDPICDKVFIGGLIISLTFKNILLIIPLFLELTVAILTIISKKRKGRPHTNFLGKIKTTALYILVAYSFLTLFNELNGILFISIYIITLILQTISLISYIIQFFKGDKQ